MPPTKFCKIRLSLSKVIKQLNSSVDEYSGVDATTGRNNANQAQQTTLNDGSYKYNQQNPLANIWCFISCDDSRSLVDIFSLPEHGTGANPAASNGRVGVDIIRKMVWRDLRG